MHFEKQLVGESWDPLELRVYAETYSSCIAIDQSTHRSKVMVEKKQNVGPTRKIGCEATALKFFQS